MMLSILYAFNEDVSPLRLYNNKYQVGYTEYLFTEIKAYSVREKCSFSVEVYKYVSPSVRTVHEMFLPTAQKTSE